MLLLRKTLYCLAAALILVGCGVKKKTAVSDQPSAVSEPAWHTCLMQGGKASITIDGNKFSGTVNMQTVRDSMLVISVMPIFGIEMVRFEATPLELTGINKIDGTYATLTYAELNRTLSPSLNWDVLQQVCSGELPTGSETARLVYLLGDQEVILKITYPARKLDVPVKVKHQNLNKYTKVDIRKWL